MMFMDGAIGVKLLYACIGFSYKFCMQPGRSGVVLIFTYACMHVNHI